jgi:hypothetical protein
MRAQVDARLNAKLLNVSNAPAYTQIHVKHVILATPLIKKGQPAKKAKSRVAICKECQFQIY